MRKPIFAVMICLALVAITVPNLNRGTALGQNGGKSLQEKTVATSVLQESVIQPPRQQEQDPPPPPPGEASPSDVPVAPKPSGITPGTAPGPAIAPGMVIQGSPSFGSCCVSCGCVTCCCPPPPVKTVICLDEPCGCCTHEICVTVPGCCAGHSPTVSWRHGILGRKIATLCWPCCNHRVKVVITAFGKVRVRG